MGFSKLSPEQCLTSTCKLLLAPRHMRPHVCDASLQGLARRIPALGFCHTEEHCMFAPVRLPVWPSPHWRSRRRHRCPDWRLADYERRQQPRRPGDRTLEDRTGSGEGILADQYSQIRPLAMTRRAFSMGSSGKEMVQADTRDTSTITPPDGHCGLGTRRVHWPSCQPFVIPVSFLTNSAFSSTSSGMVMPTTMKSVSLMQLNVS
jgi:hypothetical protein